MHPATNEALSPALQQALLRQRVELAIRETQQVRLPHSLVDLALAWVAWQAGVRDGVFVYLALMTMSHLGRSWLLQRLLASGRYGTAQLMQISMAALIWLGLIKAALSLAVFSQPGGDWHELWTMILVGNAAGGVATAGGHVRLYLAWAIPFGSGLVLGWILHGGLEGWLIALLVVALLAVLTGYVREQGRAQERLLRVNESLREARDRAEQANAMRTRFFAAASHDLRQPLTALSYGAATVLALAEQRGDALLAQVGNGLRRSLADSQALLDSLLDIAQLDAGAVEPQPGPLDLGALASGLLDSLRTQAEAQGLRLEGHGLQAGWMVHSDAALLRRVLLNLLGNALKFTLPGGRVELRLERVDDALLLRVRDDGPGIAAEWQERVFEEFFQVGNAARDRSQGLGLGLAIVRRLVHLLGLQLQLDSAPGRGSCFTLQLPLHRSDDADPSQETPLPPRAQTAGRLLIVDDEAPIREALALLMASLGWTVRSAAEADQANRQVADGWQPDALLIDLRLRDGVNGLDVLQQLRDRGCTAPAWLLSGETEPARIQQALNTGLPLLHKPVDGLALASLLGAAVTREAGATDSRGGPFPRPDRQPAT